jgi:hypothetical protein
MTSGSDVYGTTLFNARPGFATDPSPTPDEKILTRNYGRGPNQYTVNLRLAKTIGFDPAKKAVVRKRPPQAGQSKVPPLAAIVGVGAPGWAS